MLKAWLTQYLLFLGSAWVVLQAIYLCLLARPYCFWGLSDKLLAKPRVKTNPLISTGI